jgi:GAF domain-containing protein
VTDQHPTPSATTALRAIQAAARRGAVAKRLARDAEELLLQSIVDATVRLFDAEAASIALFETDPDRLLFRVAAGPQGAGAIGLSVPPTQGIAGFVYSSGQALALSDVGSDPRFDRAAAERTGYVPRSIAAVPLLDGGAIVGVLQVLDKQGSAAFSLHDMELIAVFANQAGAAIGASRVQRDMEQLLRAVLVRLDDGDIADDALDSLVQEVAEGLDRDEDAPLWGVVEQVERLRGLGEESQRLLASVLAAAADVAERRPGRTGRIGRSGRRRRATAGEDDDSIGL